jgi:hypothetical protein
VVERAPQTAVQGVVHHDSTWPTAIVGTIGWDQSICGRLIRLSGPSPAAFACRRHLDLDPTANCLCVVAVEANSASVSLQASGIPGAMTRLDAIATKEFPQWGVSAGLASP